MTDSTLRSTYFIDADNPAVETFARGAVGDAACDRERACRIFFAVRDTVRYDPYTAVLDPGALRASVALDRGRAFCVPKAVLLAAALRAVGIPSRLGFADVTNHLATKRLLDLLRTPVFAFHGYAEVLLGGHWLKATPAFDAVLCRKFRVAPLDFDGHGDAVLQPFDTGGRRFLEYLRDRGVYDDLPFDEMARSWRELYPHLFGDAATQLVRGDFDREAEES